MNPEERFERINKVTRQLNVSTLRAVEIVDGRAELYDELKRSVRTLFKMMSYLNWARGQQLRRLMKEAYDLIETAIWEDIK